LITAVSEVLSGSFQVFPNPANEMIFLIGELGSRYSIDVYNSLGEQVGQFGAVRKLDTSAWPNGVYVIRIKYLDQKVGGSQKIVVQH
ncbi:MAG: T9SS type A sorting domain-containing protein, partial [Bacteroidota bacterium]